MEAVKNAINNEYEEWKQMRRQKRDSDEEDEIAEFLANTYGIKGNESILEIIIGMVADNPEDSFGNNRIRSAMKHGMIVLFFLQSYPLHLEIMELEKL